MKKRPGSLTPGTRTSYLIARPHRHSRSVGFILLVNSRSTKRLLRRAAERPHLKLDPSQWPRWQCQVGCCWVRGLPPHGGAHSDGLRGGVDNYPSAAFLGPLHFMQGDPGGSSQCQTKFYAQNATAKEQAPALVVMAPANGRSRVSQSVSAKNVTAVANDVVIYVAAVVKWNHLHLSLSLLLLQAPSMNISRAVSLGKRKGVKGGRAAAQQSRQLTRQSRAFDGILSVFDVRLAAVLLGQVVHCRRCARSSRTAAVAACLNA